MAQTHWRLAMMFDALEGDIGTLESRLRLARDEISAAARKLSVRLGVALPRGETLSGEAGQEVANWRTVDGAVEVTLGNEDQPAILEICRAMAPILRKIADPQSIEVMAGQMYSMVPVRTGLVFLSLAFRRYPGTTVEEFRDWWFNQHSKIAIPVLGAGLLAYDQVHVEEDVSRLAAAAMGVPFVDYDAYDNLTWKDPEGFLESNSDQERMAGVAADEVGRVDINSRRYALMREID